jgi:hypothetical protein
VAEALADAYGREGEDRDKVLARIKDAFDEEWNNPTDLEPDDEDA